MSCANLRLVFGNCIRRTILRSTGYIGHIDYLKNNARSRMCRWPTTEPVVIEIELAGEDTRDIDTIAINQHNISKRAIITIEVLNSNRDVKETLELKLIDENDPPNVQPCTDWIPNIHSLCGPSVSEIAPWPKTIVAWLEKADGVPPSFVRITINDQWNTANKIEIGSLHGGQRFELTKNYAWGNNLKGLTDGAVSELASGFGVRSGLRKAARQIRLSLSKMVPNDREQLYIEDARFPNEPLLVSAYPDGTPWQQDQYTFVGEIQQSPDFSHIKVRTHSAELHIKEV